MEYLNISKKIFEINIQNIGISYKTSEMLKNIQNENKIMKYLNQARDFQKKLLIYYCSFTKSFSIAVP